MNLHKVIVFDFDGVIADSLHIASEVNKLAHPEITLKRYAFNHTTPHYFHGHSNNFISAL